MTYNIIQIHNKYIFLTYKWYFKLLINNLNYDRRLYLITKNYLNYIYIYIYIYIWQKNDFTFIKKIN